MVDPKTAIGGAPEAATASAADEFTEAASPLLISSNCCWSDSSCARSCIFSASLLLLFSADGTGGADATRLAMACSGSCAHFSCARPGPQVMVEPWRFFSTR